MALVHEKLASLKESYHGLCTRAVVNSREVFERHANLTLFLFGVALLYAGTDNLAHAGSGKYSEACNGILSLVEGAFGSLITSAAGIGAIVASAVGGFKMAWTLIVVAVGSFILRAYITLFNGTCGAGG